MWRRSLELLRWPGMEAWRRCAGVAAIGACAVAACAWVSEVVRFDAAPVSTTAIFLAVFLFFVPALGEELLFRGILYPRAGIRYRGPLVIVSVAAFVAWHPLQHAAGVGPDWTGLFITPGFIATSAVAGITLAALRARSGSLWPSILFHWSMVCIWKFVFGGPF